MALTEQSQEAVKNSLEVLTTPPGLPPLSKEQHELLELVLENLAYSAENAGLRFAFGKEK